jgi:hypothetical protein
MAKIDWSGGVVVAITKANAPLPGGRPIAILCGTPGTLNITNADGTTAAAVPCQAGYNPLSPAQVNTGGTAADLWALYERP